MVEADTGLTPDSFFSNWHHLAFTEKVGGGKAATASDPVKHLVKVFLNGAEILSSDEYPDIADFPAMKSLAFGAYADMSQEFVDLNVANDHYHGYLDEVAIFNVAKTGAEITAMYKGKLNTGDPSLLM